MGLQTHADPTLTNSKKYESFDAPSKERTAFIFSENDRVNARLKVSPSRKGLENFLKALDRPSKRTVDYIQAGKITFFDGGFNKLQEIYLVTATAKELLISNYQYAKNNTLRFSKARVNLQQTLMAVTFSIDGSDDDSALAIVDLQTKKTLWQNELTRFHGMGNEIFWSGENALLYKDLTADGRHVIRRLQITPEGHSTTDYNENYEVLSAEDGLLALYSQKKKDSLLISDFAPVQTENLEDFEYVGPMNDAYYFTKHDYSEETKETTGLYSFKPDTGQFKLEKTFNGVIREFTLLEKKYAYFEQEGYKRTLKLYDPVTEKSTSLKIPEYATAMISDNYETPDLYDLYFMSDLNDKDVTWDGQTDSVIFDDAFKAELLESPDLSLDVTFRYIPSFDGTPVPVRIVSKKGAVLQNVPVYMEAYGGFSSEGYLFPSASPLNQAFVKRGGVYVGTGIRGGNELGEAWHLAAFGAKKIKTYEDLAAIAKSLIDAGVTIKEKVVISGSSNGGLTVATTGLLYPQYFGLVLPMSGVLDLLGKEKLDSRFNDGWSYEYGDSRKPDVGALLSRISPLELIERAENGPKFLILNGRNDTRVNSAHSFKFAKAASDLTRAGRSLQVELISLNNSGHAFTRGDNDFIGARAKLIKWSRIYDELGLTF